MSIVNVDFSGFKKHLPDLSDIFIFVGLGLVFYGIHQIFPPAAYITVGVFIGAIGIFGSK